MESMDAYPEWMWFCPLGEFTTGPGKHTDFMLLDPKRPLKTNVVEHFKTHERIKLHMDQAKANGEDMECAKNQILTLMQNEQKKTGGSQLRLTQMARLSSLEKATAGLLDREKKELALCTFLLDTHTPLYRLGKKTWPDLCSQLGLNIHKPDSLRKIHLPLIFEAILRLRRELFSTAGFIHTEFDFLSAGATKYLIVCGRWSTSFCSTTSFL